MYLRRKLSSAYHRPGNNAANQDPVPEQLFSLSVKGGTDPKESELGKIIIVLCLVVFGGMILSLLCLRMRAGLWPPPTCLLDPDQGFRPGCVPLSVLLCARETRHHSPPPLS